MTFLPGAVSSAAGAVDRAILLLCSGVNRDAAALQIAESWALPADGAAEVVQVARANIVRAAAFDRDQEIGQAYYRLTDLYLRSLRAEDTKTALAAQRELNKLLSLYATARAAGPVVGADGERAGPLETAVRGYILPLGLAAHDAPLVEHLRIVASRYIDLQADSGAVVA